MTFKLLRGGRLITIGLGVGLAWACAVSDKGEFTFDDDPQSGGRGGSSPSGGKAGKGGKGGAAGSAGRATGGTSGSAAQAGEAGEAGQTGAGQGGQGAEGGMGGTGGKAGTPGLPPCDPGEKRCAGACIDVQENNDDCGDCGVACDATHFCQAGVCELDCRSNETICDGVCVDTNSDHDHCGNCATACTSREACNMGTCSLDCSGLTNCNGSCVDLTTSSNHCGDCDTVCGNNTVCVASSCGCDNSLELCPQVSGGDVCIDTSTDPDNCGGCDDVCSLPNAAAGCAAGACTVTACAGTYNDCNRLPGDGCEVDRYNDPANCGGCGTVCNLPNATEGCSGGSCTVASCSGTYEDCNNTASDGCEVDTDDDVDNCGGCDDVCNLANANEGCSSGNCTIGSCVGAFRNCDNTVSTGCEVNSNTDPANCGGCGAVCNLANANEGCSAGSCTVASCTGAFRNCNSMPGDGCEINSNTDVANCGGCGNACTVANGTAGCNAGGCTVASCTGAFRNCNSMPGDGCEVNSNTDPANCGGCGAVCNLANANEGCSGASCTVASCVGAFRNCNAMPGDGCEINTNTDAANCGGCGNACASGISCVGGVCQDPCLAHGGTLVSVNSNMRICRNQMAWGTWTPSQFPSGWNVCTLAQWAAYAPASTPSAVGAGGLGGGLWIDNACAIGSPCLSSDPTSRPWIYEGYPMNQATCYLGEQCYAPGSYALPIAVCSGAGYAAECNTPHRMFSDATRLYTFAAAAPNYCDGSTSPDWFGPGWYRFAGSAGTRMATVQPASGNCATDAAGYLNGTFPTPANGLVTRQVCYSWSGNACYFPNDIQMVNCGGYSLYNLPLPTSCNYRYCGSN